MNKINKNIAEKFVLENYGRKSTFSSFLPGISGKQGTPIWCFYVNRGQGVASFGVEDKDHAIMEFYPAHQAYQNVKLTGFRTFLRKDNVYFEAFSDVELPHKMNISMNSLELEERDEKNGIHTKVNYFTLPGESVGGLVRSVEVCNISNTSCELEILDGMPALVPYGVDMNSVKAMGQTIKAWMQVEETEDNIPYFKVRASTTDTAVVTKIEGGNFAYAVTSDGDRLSHIVDPDVVFAYDNSLQIAKGFQQKGLDGIYAENQVMSNHYPCCFFGATKKLQAGESFTIYELIGQVVNKDTLANFMKQELNVPYFKNKAEEAYALTHDLCDVIYTKTADPVFDQYCQYTYMDNVLRGGFPIQLPGDKIFYIYSRKHGDVERDYNFFRIAPEFYSQGNGNFRDVNQNRRMDNFFTPYVLRKNIKKFYGMIQLDGYNPLAVEQVSYTLKESGTIFDSASQAQKDVLIPYVAGSFTPGGFYQKLESVSILDKKVQASYFEQVMENALEEENINFGEGYWSDHWTYNLDLIENYLAIFPEKEQDLLLEESYTYYRCQIPILPRIKRYARTENGIRQYYSVDKSKRISNGEKIVKSEFGQGSPITVTLLEKLLVLCATKYSVLDAYGMGVEMEGGKPGWYDALNGLPGLLGSSMAETYELARNLAYTIHALDICPKEVSLTSEVAELLQSLYDITLKHQEAISKENELLEFWNQRNDVKEAYQDKTFEGISGSKVALDSSKLKTILSAMLDTVQKGIDKACATTDGISPTYFTYEVTKYQETEAGIIPEQFKVVPVPYFLEGAVRYLKLDNSLETKLNLYKSVKDSDLYDKALKMYKVNASLESASYEVGRAKAFTPGWLENESIWMHMEYKYLLELLKSNLYKEYLEDFKNAAIPFQNPDIYGRSIYENSSFIASSKHPNPAYHGKGFVARLSGSTVEFLQMWQIMMFGKQPFVLENDKLCLSFQPTLPEYLIGDSKKIETTFLGSIKTYYYFAESKDYIPGTYKTEKIYLQYTNGNSYEIHNDKIPSDVAKAVRDGEIKVIEIWIK